MTTVNKLQKAILARLQDENLPPPALAHEQNQICRSKDRVIIENGTPRFLTPAEVKKSCLWTKENTCVATKVEEAAQEAAKFTQKLFSKWKLASPNGNTFQEMLRVGTLLGNYIYFMKEKGCMQK